MARNLSEASESPVRHRRSPRRRSPSRREEYSGLQSRSSRSPSPRTKRLRRAQGDKEAGRSRGREGDKETGRSRDREGDKEAGRIRGREGDKETGRSRGREGDNEAGRSRDREDDKHSGRGKEKRNSREVERERDGERGREKEIRDRATASRSRHDEGSDARGGGEEPNDEGDSVARMRAAEEALAAKKKEEPSFELSGKLAEETNRYRGITLLFNEPPEARKPNQRWRLYVFKDGEPLNEPLQLHRQSCYLFGRERRIADIPTDHPSCSKQHAVIQYREVEKKKSDGVMGKEVRPYLMDLGSTNKTYINESPIEPERYYELFEKDTIKFGNSSREYVLLHENSAEG